MNAETILRNDLPAVFKFDPEKIIAIARRKYAQGVDALLASGEWERMNASQEVIFLTAFNALADEAGRTRGGASSLGDEILDRQVAKVKEYREKSYRLSAKQSAIILRDAFAWLK